MRVHIISIVILWIGCSVQEEGLYLRVDMASVHDEGLFRPENGDRLSMVGNFNNWQSGKHVLTDEDGDWIYTIDGSRLPFITDEELSFKFVITPAGEDRTISEQWEYIANRSITKAELERERPVFVFNEFWSPMVPDTLHWRVNMSNQMVLGFFEPEEGDVVTVSGSFNDWAETGVPLKATADPWIYELTLPVEIRKHEVSVYKYRIAPGLDRENKPVMINRGQEFIDARVYANVIPTDYFNNQKRVLRVVLTEQWLERQKFSIGREDVLHLKLMWNGNQSRNYRLEPNGEGGYETALQIPESAADIKGEIRADFSTELYKIEEIKVTMKGKKILF